MKVMFVCSGNGGISPIPLAQGDSLTNRQIDVVYAPITGKGFLGYALSIFSIRKQIKAAKPDIVHAHYSLSGIVSSLATRIPVVTSLMGSDTMHAGLWRLVIRVFCRYFWKATIVKSEKMAVSLKLESAVILPNGVNMDLFRPLNKAKCREKLGWDISKKYIMFNAAPERYEKNYPLAQEAIALCEDPNIVLQLVVNVKQTDIPTYLNASDLLLLTSRWEGSPNIVKEAMACNVPVVATDVGDVKTLFGQAEGCYLISKPFQSKPITSAIKEIMHRGVESKARQRIYDLGIDSESIANKLISIYLEALG